MNSLMVRNIFTNKRIVFVIVYVLCILSSFVFVKNNYTSIYELVSRNNFSCFLIMPTSILFSIILLDSLNKNILLEQRFSNKYKYALYIVKILILSLIVLSIFLVLMLYFFNYFIRPELLNIKYIFIIFTRLFSDLLLMSMFVLVISVLTSKNISIITSVLMIAISFILDINIFNILNESIVYVFLKLFLILLLVLIFTKKYVNLFEGVFK